MMRLQPNRVKRTIVPVIMGLVGFSMLGVTTLIYRLAQAKVEMTKLDGFCLEQHNRPASASHAPKLELKLEVDSEPSALVWSSSGELFASYLDFGSTVSIWSTKGLVQTRINREREFLFVSEALAFFDEDRSILVRSDRSNVHALASAYDVETGRRRFDVERTHPEGDSRRYRLASVTASHSGLRVILGYEGERPPPPQIYEAFSNSLEFKTQADVSNMLLHGREKIVFSRSGNLVAIGTGDVVNIYNLDNTIVNTKSFKQIKLPQCCATSLSFNFSGTAIAVSIVSLNTTMDSHSLAGDVQQSQHGGVLTYNVEDDSKPTSRVETSEQIWKVLWETKSGTMIFLTESQLVFENVSNNTCNVVALKSIAGAVSPNGKAVIVGDITDRKRPNISMYSFD